MNNHLNEKKIMASLLNLMICINFEYFKERLSCIDAFWSLRETGGLKIDYEIGISIL